MGGAEDTPHARRAMFRLGLKRLVEPLAGYLEERLDLRLPVSRSILRPPGALPETQFLDTCYRCGNCVDVCPAKAIRTTAGEATDLRGTPYIDPDLSACVVCEELACMKTCPSGALKRVSSGREIRMGLARLNWGLCVRSHGESCSLCMDKCPIGREAIDLSDGGEITVHASGCTGCGTCQFYCPTQPKAIMVDPS